MSENQVILVDENDNVLGYDEKLAAHRNGGRLHRAFSVVIYNSGGEMLIQQRAATKYHFGGLWTNTCCSHPLRGEEMEEAVHRRLQHELGFDTDLKEAFSFIYRAEDAKSGLVEHELDRVFTGIYDGEFTPNPEEVDAAKWIAVTELRNDMKSNPDKYTPWFQILIERLTEKQES